MAPPLASSGLGPQDPAGVPAALLLRSTVRKKQDPGSRARSREPSGRVTWTPNSWEKVGDGHRPPRLLGSRSAGHAAGFGSATGMQRFFFKNLVENPCLSPSGGTCHPETMGMSRCPGGHSPLLRPRLLPKGVCSGWCVHRRELGSLLGLLGGRGHGRRCGLQVWGLTLNVRARRAVQGGEHTLSSSPVCLRLLVSCPRLQNAAVSSCGGVS